MYRSERRNMCTFCVRNFHLTTLGIIWHQKLHGTSSNILKWIWNTLCSCCCYCCRLLVIALGGTLPFTHSFTQPASQSDGDSHKHTIIVKYKSKQWHKRNIHYTEVGIERFEMSRQCAPAPNVVRLWHKTLKWRGSYFSGKNQLIFFLFLNWCQTNHRHSTKYETNRRTRRQRRGSSSVARVIWNWGGCSMGYSVTTMSCDFGYFVCVCVEDVTGINGYFTGRGLRVEDDYGLRVGDNLGFVWTTNLENVSVFLMSTLLLVPLKSVIAMVLYKKGFWNFVLNWYEKYLKFIIRPEWSSEASTWLYIHWFWLW